MNTTVKVAGLTSEALKSKHKVNSFRSVLGGKEAGTPINFECTGDVAIVQSQFDNAQGEKIVSAYALGKGGYRLKLNENFDAKDYAAGKTLAAIVTEAEIDGRKVKWLSLAD